MSYATGFTLLLCILSLLLRTGTTKLTNHCSVDTDCTLFPYEVCDVSESECIHKQIFPLYLNEALGTGLMTVGLAMCNAAGVGGGTLLTPLFIVLAKFQQT